MGGNAIGFLKDYESLTFIEAVKELSRQTGIDIPEEDNRNLTYRKHRSNPNPAQVSIQSTRHSLPSK